MCGHFVMVDREEVAAIAAEIERDLAAHEGGPGTFDPLEPQLMQADEPEAASQLSLFGEETPLPLPQDAYPGSTVPLIVPWGTGQLSVIDMGWGFEVPWRKGPVFNARIETALGAEPCMWTESLAKRRAVVAARSFFEPHASETVPSLRTGRPIKRTYVFENPDGTPLLLAALHEQGRFSLVTTAPNSAVAPVHDRMPLVLSQHEAARWLSGDFAGLPDRSAYKLDARPER